MTNTPRRAWSSYEWDTDMDKLSSGPVLHTWEGIVRAKPTHIDYDRDSGRFDVPVCHSLAGYASGWASAFFGKECPWLASSRTS